MFYGIKTTEDWLISYAKTHAGAYDNIACHSQDDMSSLYHATLILQSRTGINKLELRSVEAVPSQHPEGNGPSLSPGPTIVAVCSNLRTSFRKRPSQVKMENLRKILGGEEPKWWLGNLHDW
jgi:hypothetical protein